MSVSIERGKGKASNQFYLRVTNDAAVPEKIVSGETVKKKQSVSKSAIGAFKQLAKLFELTVPEDKILLMRYKLNIQDNSRKKK
jgi:hypothetical protein